MPCNNPRTAYYTTGNQLTFDRSKSFGEKNTTQLPCRKCLGCRLEGAKSWAIRCSHEASLYGDENSFITLTYSPENLPLHGNLCRAHFQRFIKRLRKNTGKKIRYYMCGEYGDKTNRPHYHALLFGYRFSDCKLVNIRNKNRVYTSKVLDKTWRLGTCEIGSVTFQSAGYVARYILKKQTGDPDELFDRYVIIDVSTGEMTARHNEYTNMSLKPGIGQRWYEKYKSDLFPHDYCVLPDGRQAPVPNYYRMLLKKENPGLFDQLRLVRIAKARENPNNTPDRLAVRAICLEAKQSIFTRDKI